jgi:ADP-heptose:LPS heptosyltransferase/GT2 family glycosyltransferase
MTPKFLISILALNKLESTKACIEAVIKNSGDPSSYALYLTNNGSTDGTKEYFDALNVNKNVLIVQNDDNLGFIFPNNSAFDWAQRAEIPYFIALNNDTEVPPFWLDHLAAPLDIDPNGALSGPGFFGLKDDMHGTDGVAGEYLEGSCLCAKVEIVGRYGDLFSDYLTFIYGDDSDLSLRMREKGHKIYWTPFTLKHPRCTTVKQSPEVYAKCAEAQAKNHDVLLKRWNHYLTKSGRNMGYPIKLKRHIACGDTLLLTPVLRALHESNPNSLLYVETKSPDVLKNCRYATAVCEGYPIGDAGLTIDLEMAYEDRKEVHIIDAYADAVREKVPAIGYVDHRIEMFPSIADVQWAIEVKARNRFSPKVCAMHVDHGGWPGKNWPKERFAEVATYLVKKGWHVITVGSQLQPAKFDAFDLTGKTTTMQLAAMLKVCNLFLGGDSFPLHVADAMGCPAIGIFGVTSSKYIRSECRSVGISLDANESIPGAGERHKVARSRCVVTTDECIRSITTDTVIAAIEAIFV